MEPGVQLRTLTPVGHFSRLQAFTCGLAYASFFFQSQHLNQPDPAPIPSQWVALIKGVGLALAVLGLMASLKKLRQVMSGQPIYLSVGPKTYVLAAQAVSGAPF
jgi:hypothetical protein